MIDIVNYIDGEYLQPIDGIWIDNINPSTGKVFGKIANSGSNDVEEAVKAASKAFPSWSTTTLDQRSKILHEIANLIDANLDLLAEAEAKDNGKPLSLAKSVDIPRASANFRFFANAITQFASEAHESIGTNTINFTLRQPIGVVGCISPWNLPLYLFSWKVAPAIAAGNCVIAKPSEVTPLTAYLLGDLLTKAGLPKGVLNILQGTGQSVGQQIISHPKVKAISFTGGTATGEHIAKTAAPMFKKLSLELGGKNPNLIFADCEFDRMLAVTVKSSFANQGQICLCGSRIYVEQSIAKQFKESFVGKVASLKVGNPFDATTNLGAVVSMEHLEKIENYVNSAVKEGGRILYGGNRVKVPNLEGGFFFEPTIIEIDSNDCTIQKEEVFGPVVTIVTFSTETEAIAMANDVRYGLSATVWTTDLNRCMRVSKQLECGIVWVNTWLNRDLRTPFGGIKDSGVGREGGFEALRFFTEPKNVCISYTSHT